MKKMRSVLAVSIMLATLLSMPVHASANEEITLPLNGSEATISQTRAYEYEWKTEFRNGRLHKRLWNITLERWEGPWIAC